MTEEKNPNTNIGESEDIAQALQNIRDTISAGNTVAMGDVLELTEIIEDVQEQTPPYDTPEPESHLPQSHEQEEPVKEPETEVISRQSLKAKAAKLQRQDDDTILSPEVMAESQDMLEQFLHQAMPPKVEAKRHVHDTVTLEEFAEAVLKKEIAAWINKNLPDMVRSVIEKEIKHLISKSRD